MVSEVKQAREKRKEKREKDTLIELIELTLIDLIRTKFCNPLTILMKRVVESEPNEGAAQVLDESNSPPIRVAILCSFSLSLPLSDARGSRMDQKSRK